jgi:hypothetical protein
MQRFLYFAGFTYIALCGALLFRETIARGVYAGDMPRATPARPYPTTGRTVQNSAEEWFAAMKPYCNPVEVEVRERFKPAPGTVQGAGFSAACFALAGKIERARTIIDSMAPRDRGAAANVLFNVAHPVADAGDDQSSGPMMELVLEYWPNNYMALYHAGMSEYSLGQTELAQRRLRAFLSMYNANDGFTSAAKSALAHMENSSGLGRLRLRKNVERESPTRP